MSLGAQTTQVNMTSPPIRGSCLFLSHWISWNGRPHLKNKLNTTLNCLKKCLFPFLPCINKDKTNLRTTKSERKLLVRRRNEKNKLIAWVNIWRFSTQTNLQWSWSLTRSLRHKWIQHLDQTQMKYFYRVRLCIECHNPSSIIAIKPWEEI